MSRPIRVEFPGALYHVTSRGVDKRTTFLDDVDRRHFLELLGETVRRFGWILTAYVLMSNHFHLVLQLTLPKLSAGMQWLNGQYASFFNWRHDRVGHLLQSRPDAPLVEKDAYLLNILRYAVLNPVRAGMVELPEDYEWSSYRATAGLEPAPEWLAVDEALSAFAPEPLVARQYYAQFVHDPLALNDNPWKNLVAKAYLGTEEWVRETRERVESRLRDSEHPRAQRLIGRRTMSDVVRAVACTLGMDATAIQRVRGGDARRIAAWLGSYECMLTLSAIGAGLRLRSAGYVSTLIKECDKRLETDGRLRRELDLCREALYAL